MTMDELRDKLLSKKFTHISLTRITDSNDSTITRRIIRVDSNGCWSFSYLSVDFKIYRRLPEKDYEMINNGYIETVATSGGRNAKVKVQFITKRNNNE